MTLRLTFFALLPCLLFVDNLTAQPIDIGSRRELFVDRFLIDSMSGDVRLQLHRPIRREIVFKTDAPWEGNASVYNSVFRDGDLYRMYYRSIHFGPNVKESHFFLCYAESNDGIHWRRPELGIFEFEGSKANNIILTRAFLAEIGSDSTTTAAFKDANPDCPSDEKYKIVVVGNKPTRGLYMLGSPDGIHFSLISKKPFVTKGNFGAQNVAFWDPVAGVYREYHRDNKEIKGYKKGVVWPRTSASKDHHSFPEPEWLKFPGAVTERLYTSGKIQPYYRAPHILVGFPVRYLDRGWSEPMFDLPGMDERVTRAKVNPRYGTVITDGLFMTSRDGRTFNRWAEAFLRPGPREKDSWVYGDNFIFWGMVETKSTIEDAPNEISMYATEGYWQGKSTSFRRLTLRLDGFVSAHAPLAGGEIITKPIRFGSGNLQLNCETSGAGGVQVEIQEVDGKPIDGYALAECPPIFCDRLAQVVRWNRPGGDVRPLVGKPVRLRFVLKDADLYSFHFVPYAADPQRPSIPGRR